MNEFLATETLIIELLLVISLVALAVRRLRVPYTVALVIAGLSLTFGNEIDIDLTPELILAVFVPPLVFEAAFHIEYRRLRDNLVPILVLAVIGVLFTTVLVGVITSYGVGLTLKSGLVFGSLIAATDPVAVIALFRQLGAPKALTVVVESESLFNDGTAIVLFRLMLTAALPIAVGATGAPGSEGEAAARTFDFIGGVMKFVSVAAGGTIIGSGFGLLASQVIARVDDYLIETTVTTVLAFGTYVVAERLHVSGVLATVVAGIICGNTGLRGMSPTTRIVLFNFWEYLAFVANSLVFLLIGLDVNIRQIVAAAYPISIAIIAILVSRALVVYGLTFLSNRFTHSNRQLSKAYRHVLFWGGLRGAISLALVLSLPTTFADREVLRVMTFGVVLFTLLAQGTTMQILLNRLGLTTRNEAEIEYERRQGRLFAARAGRTRLDQMHSEGTISEAAWQQLEPDIEAEMRRHLVAQQELLDSQPQLRHEEVTDARHEALRAERAALARLQSDGIISEAIYEELVAEVDSRIADARAFKSGHVSDKHA